MQTAKHSAAVSSIEDHALIDRLCDEFETALKSGSAPALNELVSQVPSHLREQLLMELILVGLEFAQAGAPARPSSDTTAPNPHARGTARITPRKAEQDRTPRDSTEGPSIDDRTLRARETIGGYEVLEEIGRGGMGVVYLARQLSLDRTVALKIIKSNRFEATNDARRQVLLERFQTEARAASRLDHKNIATVFEVGQVDGSPYYAMRYVKGGSLEQRVRNDVLSGERAAAYLLPIARTIARLHEAGVVHRDLKPSNILIEAETDTPTLTDFGLAKLTEDERHVTLTSEGFGSPPYMAPEQILDATNVSGAADIYSLGATLYHLLTGRPPFQGDHVAEVARQIVFCNPTAPRRLNPRISRDLETICLKCLEKDEFRRYQTADDLADDLQRFLERRPIAARPVALPTRAWKWSARHPAWFALATAAVLLLVLGTIGWARMRSRELVASKLAVRSLDVDRAADSAASFEKARFGMGGTVHESLPWLVACLRNDVGTSRETVTRRRIYSLLHHGPELVRQYFHDGPVTSAEFSRSGKQVLTASADGKARIWSVESGKQVGELKCGLQLQIAVFNRAETQVATGSIDGTVRIWNLNSGASRGAPMPHDSLVTRLAFTYDDSRLVTATADHRVWVWRIADGVLERRIGEPGSQSAAISSDGRRAAIASQDTFPKLWNLEDGSEVELDSPISGVTHMAFGPDGSTIAACADDGSGQVWSAETGKELARFATSQSEMAAVGVGKHLLSTSNEERAFVRALDSPRSEPREIPHAGVNFIAASPDESILLTIGGDGIARCWRTANGTPVAAGLYHAKPVAGARFAPDGELVLTYSDDGTARVWRTHLPGQKVAGLRDELSISTKHTDRWGVVYGSGTGVVVADGAARGAGAGLLTHEEPVAIAAVDAEGKHVVAVGVNRSMTAWNRAAKEVRWKRAHDGATVSAMALSKDGAKLAVGGVDGAVQLLDASSGAVLSTLTLPEKITQTVFASAGALVVVAAGQKAHVLECHGGALVETGAIDFEATVQGVEVSPDGYSIAVYGNAPRLLIWHVQIGQQALVPTDSAVVWAAFTRKSGELLTSSSSGTTQAWRAADGAPARQPFQIGASARQRAVSPSGKTFAVAYQDGSLQLWDTGSASALTVPLPGSNPVVHLALQGDDRVLAIDSEGLVREYEITASHDSLAALESAAILRCGSKVAEDGSLVVLDQAAYLRYGAELKGN